MTMNERHMNEIRNMKNQELAAAIRVVNRQVNAKIFVGDRQNRIDVLKALTTERDRRGF